MAITASAYKYDDLTIPLVKQGHSSLGVIIGNNVWIGSNSTITDGAEIGDNVIISPNSVVSGRVPPDAIIQGNPAKVIFTRR